MTDLDQPATDPVRWGFLGAGNIATRALGPAVRSSSNGVLAAVAARDVERARVLADTFAPEPGAATAYGSYDELLADPAVEAVYISLANDAHKPWTIAALEAGKHVLCEKPLGLHAAEVDAMTEAADRTGRTLVEASWWRWHPRVRAAQQLLAEGAIGPVRHARAAFTFDRVKPGNYRLDPTKGGGALYDIGHYALSGVLWAFGEAPHDVAAKQVLGATGVDLTTDVVLSFSGGDAEVHVSIAEPELQTLVITGEHGEIELRERSFTAGATDELELWVSRDGGTERRPFPAVDAYRLMAEEFASVLRGGPGWLMPLSESRRIAEVTDACFASAAGH